MNRPFHICIASLMLVAAAGCGDDTTSSSLVALATDAPPSADDVVPKCPYTAAQISAIVGRTMNEESECFFRATESAAILDINVSSRVAGAITYDYARQVAGSSYDRVQDLGLGDRGYLAVKEIGGELSVVSPKGSYTILMESFGFDRDPSRYEQALRKLLDGIPL